MVLARRRGRLVFGMGVAISALALAGCANLYTGGGNLPSSIAEGQNANFGFNYQVTDQTTGAGKLSGTYIDRNESGNAVVKMSFKGSPASFCYGADPSCQTLISDLCNGNQSCLDEFQSLSGHCIGALANYSSTNSAYPGTGQAVIFSCDGGPNIGPNSDSLAIFVTSGPYEGYENEGPVTGGNLVAHKK